MTAARDAYVKFAGSLDGRWVAAFPSNPQRMAVDGGWPPPAEVFLLGVAHRSCVEAARSNLRTGSANLASMIPPRLDVSESDLGTALDDLSKPPATGVCAFCGDRSTTKEHILPRWFEKLFEDHGGLMVQTEGGRRRASITASRSVCGRCNNTWLSVLENDASAVLRSMVLGEPRQLSTEDLRVVASWAFKTALMLDLRTGPIVPLGFYRDYASLRRPLACSAVWLGAYHGGIAVVAYHVPLVVGASTEPVALVSTFTAFSVVFQVLHHFTRGPVDLRDSRGLRKALITAWPAGSPSDRVDWPNHGLTLSDDQVQRLAGSIDVNGQFGSR